jgi:hypothetical protein
MEARGRKMLEGKGKLVESLTARNAHLEEQLLELSKVGGSFLGSEAQLMQKYIVHVLCLHVTAMCS